jgi:HAD superfamily hydrolase (TIGR01450 family)
MIIEKRKNQDILELKPEFANKSLFILDLDGTVYKGNELIPGVDIAVNRLTELKKIIYYFTNNASKSRKNFCSKIKGMGLPCELDQVVSSSYFAARMLYEDYKVRSAFILGTDELVATVEEVGISTLNKTVDPKVLYADFLPENIRCDAIICAIDPGLTYARVRTAMELVHRGAGFYATNGDKTFPEAKQVWPGAGMTIGAIETVVGFPPKIVFGKPNIYGIDFIFRDLKKQFPTQKFNYSETLIIGDRLETDIAQANNAKIDSVLVEMGIHTRKDVPKKPKNDEERKLIPTYIIPEMIDLFK